jgi:3-oxoacyl-[acyl-carrier protein] reductase
VTGRVAVVTGGSRGIGAAVVRRLGAQGYAVAALARSACDEVVEPYGGLAVRCDVTDRRAIDGAIDDVEEHFGAPVSVLVNNAGITRDRSATLLSDDDWQAVIGTDLTAVMTATRRALRSMLRQRYGRIVTVGSVVGIRGNAGQAAYAAAKAGVIGYTKSVAREVGSRGITANVVAPGLVATDMADAVPDRVQKHIVLAVPAGRPGTVDEVAQAVAFFASPEASYVNGASLCVDGGMT